MIKSQSKLKKHPISKPKTFIKVFTTVSLIALFKCS